MLAPGLFIVILTGLVVITAAGLRLAPVVGEVTLADTARRKHALDGVRGILALSVMIHHTLLTFALHGVIDADTTKKGGFVLQLGALPVGLFFMISAYLFVGRVLATQGSLKLTKFWTGRVLRILPLYLFAVLAATVFALVTQHGLAEPGSKLLKDIVRQLCFDFVPRYGINGVKDASNVLGVVWTLRFEWLLYLLVPVLAWLYRRSGNTLMVYAPLVAAALLYDGHFWFFVAGAIVAQVAGAPASRTRPAIWAGAGALSIVLLLGPLHSSAAWLQALLLVPTLIAVVQGHRWFALLGTRPCRFLGEISFSIYLLHNLTFCIVGRVAHLDLADLSAAQFVMADIGIGTMVIAVSIVTFLLIERPGIQSGLRPIRLPRALLPAPDGWNGRCGSDIPAMSDGRDGGRVPAIVMPG